MGVAGIRHGFGCRRVLPELFFPSAGKDVEYCRYPQLGRAVGISGDVPGGQPTLRSFTPAKFAAASTSDRDGKTVRIESWNHAHRQRKTGRSADRRGDSADLWIDVGHHL